MKRKDTHYLLVIILVISTLTKGFSQNSDYSKLTVSFDPMGFLFFGPAINVGYTLNENTVIKANVRIVSLGLLAKNIRATENELYKFGGMGYSIGAIRFMENVDSGIYYGGFLSLDIQNTKYSENSEWAWHEKTTTYGLLVNGGKRFKFGSKYYVNAGVSIGVGVVRYNWEYDDPTVGIDDPEERKGTSVFPIGGLELAFGMFLL